MDDGAEEAREERDERCPDKHVLRQVLNSGVKAETPLQITLKQSWKFVVAVGGREERDPDPKRVGGSARIDEKEGIRVLSSSKVWKDALR